MTSLFFEPLLFLKTSLFLCALLFFEPLLFLKTLLFLKPLLFLFLFLFYSLDTHLFFLLESPVFLFSSHSLLCHHIVVSTAPGWSGLGPCVGVAPPPGSDVGPDIDPLHVVTGQVQRGSEGPGLQTCVLEVLRVVDLLLSHLLHFPDLHGLFLLELLLLHEGLLGLLLLLELLGLPDCGLLLEYLLLLLLLDQPLLLEGGLLLGLLLDEVISEGARLTSADRIVINDPTLGLLLPLGEEFSAFTNTGIEALGHGVGHLGQAEAGGGVDGHLAVVRPLVGGQVVPVSHLAFRVHHQLHVGHSVVFGPSLLILETSVKVFTS